MAKSMGCCPAWFAWVTLIVGVLYLIADLGWFNWGISWYTALFVLAGLYYVTMK
jgi:hypothetical protein